MKHKKRENNTPRRGQTPEYPYTADIIKTRLRDALEQQFKRKITFQFLGHLTGQLISTTNYWWHFSLGPHLVALMRLLEHIPADSRNALISSVCRTCPTPDHPRLAHDLENLRILLDVIRTRSGLTQIVGGNYTSRAFVMGALARAFYLVDDKKRGVTGLDLQPSEEFVPVASQLYLDGNTNSHDFRAQVLRMWSEIEASSSPYLLFNELWSRVPEKRADILMWARTRHIVLVERNCINPSLLPIRGSIVLKVLDVSSAKTYPAGIKITENM